MPARPFRPCRNCCATSRSSSISWESPQDTIGLRRWVQFFHKQVLMKASSNNRILMLLENQAYPQDVRVRREANALTAAGYTVSVICPAKPGQPSREVINGVRIYRYPEPAGANGFLGYLWEYAYSTAASFAISLIVFFYGGFFVLPTPKPPATVLFFPAFFKIFLKRFFFVYPDFF